MEEREGRGEIGGRGERWREGGSDGGRERVMEGEREKKKEKEREEERQRRF